MTVAVLGLGGVGGMIAARTVAVCVGTPRTVVAIREHGLRLEHRGTVTVIRPEAVEALDRPVDLLVVAVKAYELDAAVDRIRVDVLDGAVVLPLLNGLEHVAFLRERLGGVGATVLAGSIGRFQAYAAEPGRIVQQSEGALVTVASDTVPRKLLEQAVEPLRVPGVEVEVGGSEAAVLWDKAARLAVLAAATIASGATVGVLRSDSAWRTRIRAALEETCEVAMAVGVAVDPDAHWAFVEGLDPELTTSAARDAQAGRPTELDAITGSVVRAARMVGVSVPELERLLAEAAARG